MTDQHPITPPPELVAQWFLSAKAVPVDVGEWVTDVATQAAQWGADQELEACCEWLAQSWTTAEYRRSPLRLRSETSEPYINALRTARRPEPPSLKEQALAALHGIHDQGPTPEQVTIIRRALEQLDG